MSSILPSIAGGACAWAVAALNSTVHSASRTSRARGVSMRHVRAASRNFRVMVVMGGILRMGAGVASESDGTGEAIEQQPISGLESDAVVPRRFREPELSSWRRGMDMKTLPPERNPKL